MFFNRKPKEPELKDVGRAVARVITTSGAEYEVVEEGFWIVGPLGLYHKASLSLIKDRRIDNGFFLVAFSKEVPVCNIETLELLRVEECLRPARG